MASSSDVFASFLVFSLVVSLQCPYSASQSTKPSSSGTGSEGGQESSQIYVVAPSLEDCPNGTYCDTLSYYASVYTDELSNVAFWFLPGTHNISQVWKIENSRNITLLGGKQVPNSDISSRGMTEIVCQGFIFQGIHVSNSNTTVVENMTIAHCPSAVFFDEAINATVRNVMITGSSSVGLRLATCQSFTLTKSTLENCAVGISLEGSSSSELANSQVNNCSSYNIQCLLNGGSVTLKQMILNGNNYGLYYEQGDNYVPSLEEKASVGVFNTTVIGRESGYSLFLLD